MEKLNILQNNTFLNGAIKSCLLDSDGEFFSLIKFGELKVKEFVKPESIEFIYANAYNGFLLISSLRLTPYDNCKNGIRVEYRFEFTDKFDNVSKITEFEYNKRNCRKDLELINSDSASFQITLKYIKDTIRLFKSYIAEDKKSHYNSRRQGRLDLFQRLGYELEAITLKIDTKEMLPYIKWYRNKSKDEHYYYNGKKSLFKRIKEYFL